MWRIFLAVAAMMFFGGCEPNVGGTCKYAQRVEGSATIKSVKDGACIVDFRPSDRVWAEWNVKEEFRNMAATCYVNAPKTGESYRAIYEKEVAGSCKPYRVIVYDGDMLKKHPGLAKRYGLK